MSLFNFFKRNTSAPVARERLQVLLAHERTIVGGGESDLVAILREEIMAVICRHVAVPPDKVQVRMDRGQTVSTLAIDIEIPSSHGTLAAAGA